MLYFIDVFMMQICNTRDYSNKINVNYKNLLAYLIKSQCLILILTIFILPPFSVTIISFSLTNDEPQGASNSIILLKLKFLLNELVENNIKDKRNNNFFTL